MIMVVEFWHGLPGQVVGTKNLNHFKIELDKLKKGIV